VSGTDRKGVDMTTGSIAPKLFYLAWPLVLGNLLQTVYNLADLFWVGRVSREALAAVSLMFPLTFVFISTALGLTAATIALVSQYVGADDRRSADRVVAQTMLLALVVSVVLAVLGFAFRHDVLRLIGAEGAVFDASLEYIEVIFLSLPLTFLFLGFRASLQGAGDTKTAMWLVFASAGLNVVLDPFLILGWGPFPAMGTRGAAWATFGSRGVATAAGLYLLLRGGFGVRLYPRDLRPDPDILRRLLSVGYPAALDGWARSFAAVTMAAFVAPFGAAAIAAYGIGVRLMSVTWTVAGAVGQATATGVGQNLGAETPDRARRVTWTATAGTMAFVGVASALCILAPKLVFGVFTSDTATIDEGVRFLYVVGPSWALFAGTMVLQGGFRGAGQTKVALAVSVLSQWVFRIPVAIALAFSLSLTLPVVGPLEAGLGIGVLGVWIAFLVGFGLAFVVVAIWFSLGRWTGAVVEPDEHGQTAAGEPPSEVRPDSAGPGESPEDTDREPAPSDAND
jgi:putative MATE family efflux protein